MLYRTKEEASVVLVNHSGRTRVSLQLSDIFTTGKGGLPDGFNWEASSFVLRPAKSADGALERWARPLVQGLDVDAATGAVHVDVPETSLVSVRIARKTRGEIDGAVSSGQGLRLLRRGCLQKINAVEGVNGRSQGIPCLFQSLQLQSASEALHSRRVRQPLQIEGSAPSAALSRGRYLVLTDSLASPFTPYILRIQDLMRSLTAAGHEVRIRPSKKSWFHW